MFKIGEKVVFVINNPDYDMKLPKDGEVVEIHSKCSDFPDSWNIAGYLTGEDGIEQSFHISELRKIDYS